MQQLLTGMGNDMIGQGSALGFLLDAEKQPRNHLVVVDLASQEAEENTTLSWWITKELPKNAYGIDPAKYFL